MAVSARTIRKNSKRLLAGLVIWLSIFAVNVTFAVESSVAYGDTGNKRIAFSNSYAGSDFRKVMVADWQEVAAYAKHAGLIMEAPVFSAKNSAPEQAAHIQNMVLEGYDAIVILAASDTALKSIVRDACNAGITVVILASKVNESCVYEVNYDWSEMGRAEIDYIAKRLGGQGNLLEIRGIAGDATDADISDGIHKAVKAYPGLKIVNSVYGQWTASIAQREVAMVLPSLPRIDAIVGQGGDGYGAAMAFKAAGRRLPVIIMGNRHNELALWKQERDTNGYRTFSISATPSVSQVGFWVAQQILAGKKVPRKITVPLLGIHEEDLDAWLATIPEGGAANPFYSQEIVVDMIDAEINGTEPPKVPAPKEASR